MFVNKKNKKNYFKNFGSENIFGTPVALCKSAMHFWRNPRVKKKICKILDYINGKKKEKLMQRKRNKAARRIYSVMQSDRNCWKIDTFPDAITSELMFPSQC